MHVRAYQSGQYTVVGNHLAQHRALSLTAIGLAAHILSLPEGAPVDIRSLADRFPEGRDRIAFALRELEAHGYLARVRERTAEGRIVTRTYAHHTPGAQAAYPAAEPTTARVAPGRRARGRGAVRRPSGGVGETAQEDDRGGRGAHTPTPAPVTRRSCAEGSTEAGSTEAGSTRTLPGAAEPSPSPSPSRPAGDDGPGVRDHDKAVNLLAGLRRTDDRLTLSRQDVNRLARAVGAWFDAGATAAVIHRTLTADLPTDLRHPAGLIAHRLRELLPLPLPARPTLPPLTTADTRPTGPQPFQTCDGCERAFRAPEPGHCRDCRHAARRPEAAMVRAA
ncbi:helix-turn-helix domain-containing protein [Streptomyces sp. NPDC008313]|uniref:helix-turn-helix domain-containing protein n=1 Tax=Streptomyces sp. NPDC008313 TaxID=3364826 RepID=UPI0036E5B693